jgi:uncharacterized cupredoxin-like copper-binding protein
MTQRLFRIAAIGVTGMLLLIACGSPGRPSTSIKVTMTDFAFSPNAITVPAGKEITVRVTNNGAVSHDFMIMKLGHELSSQDHAGTEAHANALWEQAPLGAGESKESTFMAPTEPGDYQIICGVAGHFEAGMVGRLIVVAMP